MGLFDSLAGQVAGALLGGNARAAPAGALDAVGELISPQAGGLGALVNAFEQRGLGGVIASWIGTGQNLPIAPEQIHAVLGDARVQALAQRFGFSTGQLDGLLAQFLPGVVDTLTPNGALPDTTALGGLLGAFKNLR